MRRHRLFRRRSRWGLVRDNLHVVVTVAALVATAFAWNAISNADQPPAPQAVASDLETSPPAAPVSSSSPAEEMRVTETAQTQPAPAAWVHSGESIAPPLLPNTTPLLSVRGQPSSIATASPETARMAQPADTTKIRGQHPQARHDLRRNSPVTRAVRNHRRISKRSDGGADLNPYECKVRRKPPCFDENDRR